MIYDGQPVQLAKIKSVNRMYGRRVVSDLEAVIKVNVLRSYDSPPAVIKLKEMDKPSPGTGEEKENS